MQEYRLRLLLLDRNTGGNPTNPGPSLAEQQSHQQPVVVQQPPNYRAHLRNAMLHAMNHSRPPSYKSHISDHPDIESAQVALVNKFRLHKCIRFPELLRLNPITKEIIIAGKVPDKTLALCRLYHRHVIAKPISI